MTDSLLGLTATVPYIVLCRKTAQQLTLDLTLKQFMLNLQSIQLPFIMLNCDYQL